MKTYKEVKSILEELSKDKLGGFTFKIVPHTLAYPMTKNEDKFDFSIVTLKSEESFLDLNMIEGMGNIKIHRFNNELTVMFAVNHY